MGNYDLHFPDDKLTYFPENVRGLFIVTELIISRLGAASWVIFLMCGSDYNQQGHGSQGNEAWLGAVLKNGLGAVRPLQQLVFDSGRKESKRFQSEKKVEEERIF